MPQPTRGPARRRRTAPDFVQDSLFEVALRPERRYYRQMLDALTRSDFGGVALDAEIVVSKLFGTVWAAQPYPRDGSLEESFGLGLVEYAGQRPSPTSLCLLRTLETIAPVREVREAARETAVELIDRGLPSPQWTPAVGTAAALGSWAFEDAFGDRTLIVCEFGYEPRRTGRHTLAVDIDHARFAAAVDVTLRSMPAPDQTPADPLDAVAVAHDAAARQATAAHGPGGPPRPDLPDGVSVDPRSYTLLEVDPAWARAVQARALARTDLIPAVRARPGLVELRALALSRLAVLADTAYLLDPDPVAPDAAARRHLVAEFLASPEAQDLPDAAALAELLVQYGCEYDPGQVDRVSPAKWETFVYDWWPDHGSAATSEESARVLRAWSAWGARRMALTGTARAELAAALDEILDTAPA